MKSILYTLRLRWSQQAINGGWLALSKQNQWGMSSTCLNFLDGLIAPRLKKQMLFTNLRDVSAVLQTETIDELTADLFSVKQTILKRSYIDDRTPMTYITPEKRTASTYLALASGRSLSPFEAYTPFFNSILQLAQEMDEVLHEESTNDDDWYEYYTRRYQLVFDEAFEVMRFFARLVELECPTHHAAVNTPPAKR
jgi:hypothetical protein